MEIPSSIKKWIEDEAEKKFPGVKAFYIGADYELADSIADRKVGFVAGATSLYQHLQENGRVEKESGEVLCSHCGDPVEQPIYCRNCEINLTLPDNEY